MDVPAVKGSTGIPIKLPCTIYPSNQIYVSHDQDRCEFEKEWSCADKRRVLLTGEDGKKHCILFPKRYSQ